METERASLSFYSVLGVSSESSIHDIKRAYRKLAMQWHPDRWTRTPSLLGETKRKFQQIQEAYSVLSDQRKRTMYDVGLYDPGEEQEEDEGLSDFVQELMSLMAQDKREIFVCGQRIRRELCYLLEKSREFRKSINIDPKARRTRITVWGSCNQCSWRWYKGLNLVRGTVALQFLMILDPQSERDVTQIQCLTLALENLAEVQVWEYMEQVVIAAKILSDE